MPAVKIIFRAANVVHAKHAESQCFFFKSFHSPGANDENIRCWYVTSGYKGRETWRQNLAV